jgi:uncharacterized protein (DUF1697 family)
MPRYVLLLRGVNVGTKNSLPMADLRAMLSRVGCADVQTYVQSGNAVFTTKLATTALTKKIEAALAQYMGRPIATTLRTRDELAAVVDANPFGAVATNPSHFCVTFLSGPPSESALAPLHEATRAPERFHAAGREIYSWHPNGQGRSPLAQALSKLRVPGSVTTRNWNTVQKLLAMVGDA